MTTIFNDKHKMFKLEKLCYLLFIYASIIDIIAIDNSEQAYLSNTKTTEDLRSDYLFASILILIVFIIFLLRNYNNYSKLSKDSPEYNIAQIRLIGSILIVTGQLLTIYYFINTTTL